MIATFDHVDYSLIIVAAIGAMGGVAVGVLNFVTVHRNRALILAETDTLNGRKLGETVHDMAQTLETVAAQLHTQTKMLHTHLEDHAPQEDIDL